MKARIAVLGGDGIGPEVVAQATRVLDVIATSFGHTFELEPALLAAPRSMRTATDCRPTPSRCASRPKPCCSARSAGEVGAPDAKVRPEAALLRLRRELGVFANLRPVAVHPALRDSSPLKPAILDGTDFIFVRELTGGIYFGEKRRTATEAVDVCTYSVAEIERIARTAGHLARARRRRVTSIDKANVLETSRLWRSVVGRVMADEFADIALEHALVDSTAMHLIQRPRDFDVLLTENMFGDILSDEASMLAGSLGVLPSASLGDGKRGLYGRSTAPRPTSRAAASRTRSARSSPQRSCCAIRFARAGSARSRVR